MDRIQHAERRDLRRRGGRVNQLGAIVTCQAIHDLSGRLFRVGRFQHADDAQQPGHYQAPELPGASAER